jgi:hypothetical protein
VPTPTKLRKLEDSVRILQLTLATAVADANNRPGILAVAKPSDASRTAMASPYKWATAEDQERADLVVRSVCRRVVDDAAGMVPAIADIPLGAVVTLARLSLPAAWDEDYARTAVGLLRDMLEPRNDGSYLRRDREMPTTPDGHFDVHEVARHALIDRGLLSDESHIAALLAATE